MTDVLRFLCVLCAFLAAAGMGQCQPNSQRQVLPGMNAAGLGDPPPNPPLAPIEGYQFLIFGGLLLGAKKIYDRKKGI